MRSSPHRQFVLGFCLFFATTVVGFVVYRLSGWTPMESFYMVVITIFGVGYGEVRELTPALQLFTALFIIAGCSVLIYTAGAMVNWLTEGQLEKLLGKRKMEKEIKHLNGHVVICGYGRMGRLLAATLHKASKPFVIIDRDAKRNEEIRATGHLCLEGDATEETILTRGRIEEASVLACVLPNDAANVFIVLSCRALNPKLKIIARANQISSEAKLRQAGTDKVVMPAAIGADRIANMVLKPNAREVLEKDLQDSAFIDGLGEIGLEMDEIPIPEGSPLVGQALEHLETKQRSAFIVVAVRSENGHTTVRPSLDLILGVGDTLIVMSHLGVVPDFVARNARKRERVYRGQSH